MIPDIVAEQVRKNHYTHSVPSGASHGFMIDGVCVIYSIPANYRASRWLIGSDNEVWELTRLWAEDGHPHDALTHAIAESVKLFKKAEPGVKALLSYADPNQGHHGGVYRAASWAFLGASKETRGYLSPDGTPVSRRVFHTGRKHLNAAGIAQAGFTQIRVKPKLRFAKGLTRQARALIRAHPENETR